MPRSVIGFQPVIMEVCVMLVLSRKVGEEIVIGNNIRVRVLAVQGGQIRLGFIAPREVTIQRQELLEPGRDRRQRPGPPSLPRPDAIVEAPPQPEPER
jgi:carbon storage regulator CsrA